jgi:hypothetical protein
MEEITRMRAFARELDKLETLPREVRLGVLRWLEIKLQAMVKALEEQAG